MKHATTTNITDVINEFITNCTLFTAYDITKHLRHNGFFVDHSQVKNVIRTFDFASDDYQHTIEPSLSAYVYHPYWIDISNYNKDDIPAFTASKTSTQQSSSSHTSGSGSIFDKRGRFTVQCKHVRGASLNPYSKVKIDTVNGQIVITKATSTDHVNATVDKYSNIRISRRTFENAFSHVPNGDELVINVVNDNGNPKIVIAI